MDPRAADGIAVEPWVYLLVAVLRVRHAALTAAQPDDKPIFSSAELIFV